MSAEFRCPLCGTPMTLRTARFGPHRGTDFWGCPKYPNCKGSLNLDGSTPNTTPKSRVPGRSSGSGRTPATGSSQVARTGSRSITLRRGDLLVSSYNDLGPGKLVGTDGDQLVLEYFDSPGERIDNRLRMPVPRTSLRRAEVKPETRVFWRVGEDWRSGRVVETTAHRDILIRSKDGEAYVAEERLFVRWSRPLSDPVGFAAGPLLESPLLADMRRPFLRSILRQRAAARGMGGALSSAIELHDHQLEAAWRVLQDPIQRYLLADEVGLGKTIEAGIILRQLLLEDPSLSVQLVLPPFLIEQWRRELDEKFFTRDFSNARIRFSRNDAPDAWAPSDILIVDEAHNLAALAGSDSPELVHRHERLAQLARETPRLLLLSATPALNNEPVFLAMLKMLDSAIYSEVSVEQLRDRLASRADLGRTFLGLQSHLPAPLIRGRLAELRQLLAGDEEAQAQLQAAAEALEDGDRGRLRSQIDGIRTHVAEVYRVHRRMLRTRRTSALEQTYRVTGRQEPQRLALGVGLAAESTNLLENWRQEVVAAHDGDPSDLAEPARALAEAVSCTFDPQALAAWALSRTAASAGEQSALDRIARDLAFRSRRNDVAAPVADALTYKFGARDKVVVFCPTTDLVADLAAELRSYIPGSAVFEHRSTDSLEDIGAAIRKFESARSSCVLVVDSSAEEGRNFQFASLLVHIGFPARANRLEQRIGRCDRWQGVDASGGCRSIALADPDPGPTYAEAWWQILNEGFGVFTSSIASLQSAVDAADDEAWRRLLIGGLGTCDSIVEAVRATLASETERVREQDALDSIESTRERTSSFEDLRRFESDEGEFGELTHSLLADGYSPGNIRFRAVSDPRRGVGGYDALSTGPGRTLHTPLVPIDRLTRDFLPLRAHRGTFVRSISVATPDTHLFRYGDPLIDAVSDFLWHDDRGRAFGMWRWRPDWGRGTQIAYRFDYAVEARPTAVAGAPTTPTSLGHRADGLFPPLIVTIWVDRSGRQVTDVELILALEAPYSKAAGAAHRRDFSLNHHRIHAAYHYIPQEDWAGTWRGAEESARNLVAALPTFQSAVAAGLGSTQSDSSRRVRQLRLRAQRALDAERSALESEAASELETGRSLAAAVQNPRLRLDSTGVVIVTGEEPPLDGKS